MTYTARAVVRKTVTSDTLARQVSVAILNKGQKNETHVKQIMESVNRRQGEVAKAMKQATEEMIAGAVMELASPQVTSFQEGVGGNLTFKGVTVPFAWRKLSKSYAFRWMPKSKSFWKKTGVTLEQFRRVQAEYTRKPSTRYYDKASIQNVQSILDAFFMQKLGAGGGTNRRVFRSHLYIPKSYDTYFDLLLTEPFALAKAPAGKRHLPKPIRMSFKTGKFQSAPREPASTIRAAYAEYDRPWMRSYAAAKGQLLNEKLSRWYSK